MNISLVVSDLSTRGAGRWGGAVRPFLLTQALQRLGHSVEMVGFVPAGAAVGTQASDGPIHIIQAQPYPYFFRSAAQLLGRLRGDVIYAYKLKPTSFGLGMLRCLTSRQPLLLDIDDWELSWHGGDRIHYRPSAQQLARDILKPDGALRQPDHPLYLKWIEGWVNRADAVTTHTQFLRDRFGGTYVPNGKDIDLFRPDAYNSDVSRRKLGLSNYRVLMFPGAPRPYKGLEDILAAIAQINEPDIRLVIVGGSPYDDYDQQLMHQWRPWMVQLPKVSYEQMPEVVSAAHMIVVPQRDVPATRAQFPLKLTDGMAMAKPILATTVGDIPDILGETGYLVTPNHVDQMAQTIRWMFQNMEEAQEKGRQARQRCVEKFSIESMAASLAPIFDQL
ncbi:MAG: glycosyltransferase family 4 protein [Elainellaceae cyanobacterium]